MHKRWENPMLSLEDRLGAAEEEIARREEQLASVVSMSAATARGHIPAVDKYMGLLEHMYDKVASDARAWEEVAYNLWEKYHRIMKDIGYAISLLQETAQMAITQGDKIREEVFGQKPEPARKESEEEDHGHEPSP